MEKKVGMRTLKGEKELIESLLNGIEAIKILPVEFTSSDVVSLVLSYIRMNANAYQQADYYLKTGYSPFKIKIGSDAVGEALKSFMEQNKGAYDFSNTSMARAFFKNWETNTTFDITQNAYIVIDEFKKKYLGKFGPSQIIKACLYTVLTNVDYSTDILTYFILASNITLISLSFAADKYTTDDFKRDFIALSIPKVSTTPFDIKNYEKVYDWLLQFKYATDFQAEYKEHKILFMKWMEMINPLILVKEANIKSNEYTAENATNCFYTLFLFYSLAFFQIASLTILYSISKQEKNNKIQSTPMDLSKTLAERVFSGKEISFKEEYQYIMTRINYWVETFKKNLHT